MILSKEQQTELAECLLDMGALLLDCGAEISRVEDTIGRIGRAYGASHVDAFVITSLIILSMEFDEEDSITETRRVFSSAGTDFYRLEKLNDLSRRCCAAPLPLDELRRRVRHVAEGKKPDSVIFLGGVLAAGGFAVFFGGGIADGVAAAVFAVVICLLQKRFGKTRISTAGSNLIIALLAGLGVGLLCELLPVLHMDKILIGDIMLLIPGIAMTNAIRNMLGGNTISGAVRLIESLVWAAALAGGFMTAMLIVDLIVV
ncbi:MAG: threonine/serine exporter family protein [Oscillospiraceae bacterium]|nr:threonine/serine exporter family protein [Oscillospiraceae bacterium]MBQ9686005.1 threonine/serine exporter family protein [Oscillospiraceae bacterium]